MSVRGPSSITLLVIHCSASPNGCAHTEVDIDRWHAARGFKRAAVNIGHHAPHLKHIGYHFVIRVSGVVRVGRRLGKVGAHALGHNSCSIGTCLIGTDRFTAAQWQILRSHVESLCRDYPGLKVVGHRDLSPDANGDVARHEWLKTCPGFDVAAWMAGGMAPLSDHLCEVPHPHPTLPRKRGRETRRFPPPSWGTAIATFPPPHRGRARAGAHYDRRLASRHRRLPPGAPHAQRQ